MDWTPREPIELYFRKRVQGIAVKPSVDVTNSRQWIIPNKPHINWKYYQQSSRMPKFTWQPHYWWGGQNGIICIRIFWWYEGWCPLGNTLGSFGDFCGCLVHMCIFQYGLYLWVILPQNVKEGQKVKLQVIRGSPYGKKFLSAVPWLYRGTL